MEVLIDLGIVRGALTAVIFAAFIGLVLWAYSSRRDPDFRAAAQLPLEENTTPTSASRTQGDST